MVAAAPGLANGPESAELLYMGVRVSGSRLTCVHDVKIVSYLLGCLGVSRNAGNVFKECFVCLFVWGA